jgi:hypothetical protein
MDISEYIICTCTFMYIHIYIYIKWPTFQVRAMLTTEDKAFDDFIKINGEILIAENPDILTPSDASITLSDDNEDKVMECL